jgi:hypothetical protein
MGETRTQRRINGCIHIYLGHGENIFQLKQYDTHLRLCQNKDVGIFSLHVILETLNATRYSLSDPSGKELRDADIHVPSFGLK